MELKIELNTMNGGYCCTFTYKGKEYYADIAYTLDAGPECMIFHSENRRVTDWFELYANRDVCVTKECLRECVEEFIEQLNKEEGA